jgi:hypothetical protein
MVRKGYIERQIAELGEVAARLLGLRQEHNYRGALMAMSTSCEGLTGLKMETLATLDDETLLSLFRTGRVLDSGRCLIAGLVLKELALIAEAQKNEKALQTAARKAGLLLAEALYADVDLRATEYHEALDWCVARAGDAPILTERVARLAADIAE